MTITSGWIRFNTRSNPCPVCGEGKECRQSRQTKIIFCRGAIDNSGFKFLGEDTHGFGMFIEGTQDDADRGKYLRRQQAHKQSEARQRPTSMPDAERHRWNSRLLDALPPLAPEHVEDLLRRGFKLKDLQEFRSVKAGQQLPEQFPSNLPGVSYNRRSLLINADGYIYPVRNAQGQICAWQLRVWGATENKYRWLSSGGNYRLSDGEIPLAHITPEHITRNWIAFSEGTGPKPHLAAQRLACPVIGAAGGNFAGSQSQVKAAQESGRIPVLLPDGGAVTNPHVIRHYEKLAAIVPDLKVLWWEQWNKGQDIDEVSKQVLESARLITWKEFQEITRFRSEAGDSELVTQQQRASNRYDAETERIMTEFNGLRVKPTSILSGRYIPSGTLQLPQTAGIVLIDGSMGVGKTSTALKELVEQHRRQHPTSFRGLLTPRNALGRQSATVLGLPHHTTFKGFGPCPNEVTLCPESGWRFPTKRLPDGPPLLLIDEVSQLLHQVLEGKTSGQNHALNLCWLRSLFEWVKEQGGWIVLSEDGITNLEIDLITQASGLEIVEFLKFERTDRGSRNITLFSSPSLTWAAIKKRLSKGENLIIASDSAKWLRQTREMAIAFGIDPDDIRIIDSESSLEEWAQQLSTNPDQWIAKHRPRILGYSPTFQQGISIADPNGHFQSMAIHLVHLDWRSAKQMPERLRTDVPRFGYVKPSGARTDKFFSSCRPEVIVRDFYRNIEGVGKLTQFAQYAQSKEVTDADGVPLDLVEAIARLKASEQDPDSDFGFWLHHYARYQARGTYNRLTLRESLVELWEARGYNVQRIEGIAKAEIEERQRISGRLAIAKATTFAQLDSAEMPLTEARSILEELEATQEQRELAHKRLLQDKLPGVDLNDPQFILKALVENNGRFLKTAELLWMAQNPEATQWLDRWTWINEFTQATRRGQLVSYNRLSFRSGQAKLLNECPLQPFIDGIVQEWDNNSQEAIAVHQWAVLHRHQFRRYLRLNISEDHPPVKTVNKLLRKLGYEVKHQRWKGSREQRERQYGITNLQDTDRDAILKALEEGFIKRLEDKEGTSDPAAPVPVIATCLEIPPFPTYDHGPQPDWSKCPPEVVVMMQAAWADAENEQQRQAVLDAIADYGRAIA